MSHFPLMRQKWRNLFFLHWEYSPQEIQSTLPPTLRIDTFGGKAYIGVIPFQMKEVRLSTFIPLASDFLEMNVRTYVIHEKWGPGIWFYSLDTNRKFLASLARRFYLLPYFYAELGFVQNREKFSFMLQRDNRAAYFEFLASKALPLACKGTLEYFLVERYRLFTHRNKILYYADVEHHPYPLNESSCSSWSDKIIAFFPFSPSKIDPVHCIYSAGVDVKVFPLKKVPE